MFYPPPSFADVLNMGVDVVSVLHEVCRGGRIRGNLVFRIRRNL